MAINNQSNSPKSMMAFLKELAATVDTEVLESKENCKQKSLKFLRLDTVRGGLGM